MASWGCAARRPWRLVKRDAGQLLIPPDVRNPDLETRTLIALPGDGSCPSIDGVIAVNAGRKRVTLTFSRQGIEQAPAGWLARWSAETEERRCLASGEAMRISEKIVDSLPLDPAAAFRLLYASDLPQGEVALVSHVRLQLVTPYLIQAGVGAMAEGPYSVTGEGYSLTVTGKGTHNVVGYEKALYAVQSRVKQPGFEIVPLHAERHAQDQVQSLPRPAINYFRFPPEARFYRLFYKAEETDYTAIVVAARTPAELEQRIAIVRFGGAASCEKLHDSMCVAIPKDVALNPLIAVTVNGTEVLVSRGANVFNAIRSSGETQPNRILPKLRILRPWNGKMVPVSFDHADRAILKLILKGGEAVSWPGTNPKSN